jgi:16S rRNA (adenine1518-N6/adenine1519-N6)-dimethyltransferase
MTQYHCFVEQLFVVPPEAFDPAPKVDSAIIYLQPKAIEQRQQVDVEQLNSVVTQAFSQRRKTVSNTLKNIATEADFLATKIDPKQRPETISLEQYIALTQQLTKH